MTILALDTARRTGFAVVSEPGGVISWGARLIGPEGGSVGSWLSGMHALMGALLDRWQPSVLAYMAPIRTAHDSNDRLEKLFGLTGIINMIGHQRGLRIVAIEDSKAIAFVCGGQSRWPGKTALERRNRKKRATMEAVLRYGCDVNSDDDAADAIAALLAVENRLFPDAAVSRGVGPLFQESPSRAARRSAA